jgi:sarcosine oxidase gamma subunit
MSREHLAFLSPDLASAEAVWRSPLERALVKAPERIEDVSRTAVFEVTGNVAGLRPEGFEVVPLTPERALVLCAWDETGGTRAALGRDYDTVDVSAGWAGLRVRGETVLRRLTDLDLDALPAVGPVAHVRALVLRDDADTFRVLVPQEYAHSVAEAVLDAVEGVWER